jgi:hypothetical protein
MDGGSTPIKLLETLPLLTTTSYLKEDSTLSGMWWWKTLKTQSPLDAGMQRANPKPGRYVTSAAPKYQ